MKHMPLEYCGCTAMDRRCAAPMIPWIISEIKKKNVPQKVNVLVASGDVSAYVTNKEQPLFRHSLRACLKPQVAPPASQDPKGGTFLYMIKGNEGLYYYHLFRAKDAEAVQELFGAMKEQSSSSRTLDRTDGARESSMMREAPQRSLSSAAALTSIADISPSSSHFFEVLYVGKTRIAHAKVPESFIDDVLVRFQTQRGLEKSKSSAGSLLSDCHQLRQQSSASNLFANIRRDSQDSSTGSDLGSVENVTSPTIVTSPSFPTAAVPTTPGSLEITTTTPAELTTTSQTMMMPPPQTIPIPKKTLSMPPGADAAMATTRNRAASTGNVMMMSTAAQQRRDSSVRENEDLNRTMLFQVGRLDLRLISPDRKKVLLHKQLRDVASCVQGVANPEHFGFICRDGAGGGSDRFVGFIFKCQSESVADELVGAITQAFMASVDGLGGGGGVVNVSSSGQPSGSRMKERPVISCEHCPMVWYSKLVQEIEAQPATRVQSIIFSRLEMLPEEDQVIIVTKYKGAESINDVDAGASLNEQNKFLMRLLRAHCEAKQMRHVHDTAENRSEFLNQYLSVGVGSTIFMKAKRSLTNSFDHLMKRKGSKDDFGLSGQLGMNGTKPNLLSPVTPTGGSNGGIASSNASMVDLSPESQRPRSLRVSPEQQISLTTASPKSPMMDIFLKVGNSPKMSPPESSGEGASRPGQQQSGSWRQAILNSVVTPGKDKDNKDANTKNNANNLNNNNINQEQQAAPAKRSREELRAMWKKAINQQLILIRMEKENARLRIRQEEATVKRIKLEYDELSSCNRQLVEVWDLLVSKESRVSTKCDNQMLLQAIKQGVPRGKRGEVWQFLAEQFCMKQPPLDTRDFPNYNTPYELLLKQLTSQQHAILIDLGRTFPNHPYYSSPLGPGQLALFNLLKAYSLLDHEVEYCQGLSFVAAVLLLHMSEDQAFFLLRHLMFRRGLRKLYLPDMAALQLHLYQLSRLLHDRLPDVYSHFDKHEVSPTLYATSWLLTIFASQFPLGFVTRVFDLLFLESSEVIFRVALALLEEHQDQLLICDSFEEIMEYLKTKVPAVDNNTLDRVMKRVFYPDMEMAKQLNEYRVEYQVLQEEMLSVKPQIENMEKLEAMNKELLVRNQQLQDQFDDAMRNIKHQEAGRKQQLATLHRLESQNRSLEVTIFTMGSFIQQMIDQGVDVEIPGDVRRIVNQLMTAEKRRSNNNLRTLPNRIPEDNNNSKYDMQKSNSTGKDSRLMKTQSMIGTPYPLKSALSQPNLGSKLEKSFSSFFANSHNHIKQQRELRRGDGPAGSNEQVNQGGIVVPANDENDPKTVNIDIQITDTMQQQQSEPANGALTLDPDSNLKINAFGSLEKSVSLPRNAKIPLKSSKSAYELGSVKKILTTKLEDVQSESISNLTGSMHPLDTCSDVNFTYGGTTKLKCLKPVRATSGGSAGAGHQQQNGTATSPDNNNREMQQQQQTQILSR
ncbi:TBC1 domain family member 1 isoform X1 [Trichogramma pretiosum]|uniref:TBC1 domain family member 1 isoform X1 n=2 Tax=Trichogramma pretiosum TaxID=7493 RepID=UPI0006C9B246|nr:TBC1 domain family member 1 isoform X1 [Trichogramma pretiosum]XP_023317626.1 TBC1 domain family member 1 isoform X1 [Trichogramma pretiosum]XP_023317627.1 TBC1 domain family member 1 isoform X1 [Trichogramma pretiosum]XP_023317628.1 TBC1 domain family member 1 isoform X1 [Trichogramma pretiosum]XP_023317629.1 TBC1 domain family member 1 isoform X1 [Trichogramma pretiosum]